MRPDLLKSYERLRVVPRSTRASTLSSSLMLAAFGDSDSCSSASLSRYEMFSSFGWEGVSIIVCA